MRRYFKIIAAVALLLAFNVFANAMYMDPETGIDYDGFRDYNPKIGRFIESDPIGQAGGTNTYNYVHNNPLTHIDPLGLMEPDGPECAENEAACGNGSISPTPENLPELLRLNGAGGSQEEFLPPEPPAPSSPTAEPNCPNPNFIASPNGRVFPVPNGASGPLPTDNGNGFQYVGGEGGNGLSNRVNNFRLMGPKQGFPNGYGNYGYSLPNGGWQTVNPYTGQSISPNDLWWHISQ